MIKIIVYLSALLAALLVGCNSKTTDKNNNASNDSIQKYIALASNDTLDHAEKVKILDKATTIIKNSENSLKARELNYKIITKYFDTKDWAHYKNATEILFLVV